MDNCGTSLDCNLESRQRNFSPSGKVWEANCTTSARNFWPRQEKYALHSWLIVDAWFSQANSASGRLGEPFFASCRPSVSSNGKRRYWPTVVHFCKTQKLHVYFSMVISALLLPYPHFMFFSCRKSLNPNTEVAVLNMSS